MARRSASTPRRVLTPQQREEGAAKAAELSVGGMSRTAACRQVANQYGVTPRTVRNWINNAGVDIPNDAYPAAFRDFNNARRSEAGNRLAEVLEGRIDQLHQLIKEGEQVSSREIRELAIAFGVLTDKRRLEEGLSTDRVDTQTVPAREIIAAKVDELADRRKKRPAIEPVDTPKR